MMMGFVSGTTLFVEGKVDAELLSALVGTTNLRVTISQEGDKYGLRNKVKVARKNQSSGQRYFFLRDRDFDFEVAALTELAPRPILDQGWHWCRHEIENYLLEPEVLHRYLLASKREVTLEEVKRAISDVALQIRHYQAARWTIGNARQKGIPYPSDLTTRPHDVEEFRLPLLLGDQESVEWAVSSATNFVKKVSGVLEEAEVRNQFQLYQQMFTEQNCRNVDWVLHHFSGKDLLAGMKLWFEQIGMNRNTKKFVEDDLTPWVARNLTDLLEFVPEWRVLLDILRSIQG